MDSQCTKHPRRKDRVLKRYWIRIIGLVAMLPAAGCNDGQPQGQPDPVQPRGGHRVEHDRAPLQSSPPTPERIGRAEAIAKGNAAINKLMDEFRTLGEISAEEMEKFSAAIRAANLPKSNTLGLNLAIYCAKNLSRDSWLNVIRLIPHEVQVHLLGELMPEVANNHGFEAAASLLASVQEEKDIMGKGGASKTLAKWIIQHDVPKAMEWVKTVPEEDYQLFYAIHTIQAVIQMDLESGDRTTLDAALAAVDHPQMADLLYETGYEFLHKSDPELADQWLLTIEEDRALEADRHLVRESSHEKAVDFINTLYESGMNTRGDAALFRFAQKYEVTGSPQAVLEMIRDFPRGAGRERIVRQMAAEWSHKNPESALHWAESFPNREIAAEVAQYARQQIKASEMRKPDRKNAE